MEKNGTFASFATARASIVFPVPGGPTSKTPLGILAPIFQYFLGLFKKSTTSFISSFASFKPAISLKVTFSFDCSPDDLKIFAGGLRKLKVWFAAPFVCLNIIQKNQMNRSNGKKETRGIIQFIALPFSSILIETPVIFSGETP